MKGLTVSQFKRGLEHFLSKETRELKVGEKITFIALIGLFEGKDLITKHDIIKDSNAKQATVYAHLKELENKGYINSQRSNQFYSLSYVSLTDKGNLFASRLRRILAGK